MEELLNKLKELNVIRAIGDYSDYEPDGKHKDTIYFAEDESKIYLNGNSYGGSDINVDELLADYAKTTDLDEIKPVILDDSEIGYTFSSNSINYITEKHFNILNNKVKEAFFNNKLLIIKTVVPGFADKLFHNIFLIIDYLDYGSGIIIKLYDGNTIYYIENGNKNNDGTIKISIYSYIVDTSIKQTTGTSTTNIMSQKACTDLFVQKVTGKQLSTNDYNTADKNQVALISNKVDKVEGKQLSTEDFTTALKDKLDGLTNYDDTELTAKINELKNTLDTILDSENTTAVIDTFQEIEAFLAGITNAETLTGLLADLKSDIIALCNNTYVAKTDLTTTGEAGKVPQINNNGMICTRSIYFNEYTAGPTVAGWYRVAQSNNGFVLLHVNKSWYSLNGCDYMFLINIVHIPTITQLGARFPINYIPKIRVVRESSTKYYIDVYYTATKDTLKVGGISSNNCIIKTPELVDDEVPEGYTVTEFDTINGTATNSKIRASNFLIPNGTSSQFLKADGSVDDTEYYHAGNAGAGSGLNADMVDGLNATEFFQNINVNYNSNLNNIKVSGKYCITEGAINIPNDTVALRSILLHYNWDDDAARQVYYSHVGSNSNKIYTRIKTNDTWSNWIQIAYVTSNVASADKLTTKSLTNEDLNNIKDTNFSTYHAGTNNTCLNKPNGVTAFSLITNMSNTGSFFQMLYSSNMSTYTRKYEGNSGSNNGWTPWKRMLTEDDLAGISSPANPTTVTLTGFDGEKLLAHATRAFEENVDDVIRFTADEFDAIKNLKEGDKIIMQNDNIEVVGDVYYEMTITHRKEGIDDGAVYINFILSGICVQSVSACPLTGCIQFYTIDGVIVDPTSCGGIFRTMM